MGITNAMLIIRKQQMEALGREARRTFEARLRSHIQQSFEQVAVPNETDLESCIEVAFGLGIKRERDVARYCELVCRYGAGCSFEAWPKPARTLLLAYGVPAADRLRNLERWIQQQRVGMY
jgi:hypothetical protein